jgi:hypothetical protein
MKLNNKGVSLISLTITIIVLIIIAGIAISMGFGNVDKGQKAAFVTDLEMAVTSTTIYSERALQYGIKGYKISELTWDGKSDFLENSGKVNFFTNNVEGRKIDPQHPTEEQQLLIDAAQEDTVIFLFNTDVPNTLKNKIYIKEGRLYVSKEYPDEYAWAIEAYEYMSGDH